MLSMLPSFFRGLASMSLIYFRRWSSEVSGPPSPRGRRGSFGVEVSWLGFYFFFGLIIALSDSILWRHSLSIVLRCFGFPDNNLIMAAQQNDGVPREGPGLDWHPRRTKKYGAWVRIHSRWPTTVCDDSSIKERQIDPWLLFSSVSCT